MQDRSNDHELLRRYFLGVASDVEREAVEEQYFAVDTALEPLLQAEAEVIDDYVRGVLTESERALFETNFLCTADRRQRLESAKSLMEAFAGMVFAELSVLPSEDHYLLAREVRGLSSLVEGQFQEEAKTDPRYGTIREPAFDRLLEWLDPVRARAAEKYEEIRRKLIKLFASRGLADAEDLADETIDRVSRAVQSRDIRLDDPAAYFYAVANYVSMGASRSRLLTPSPHGRRDIEELAQERLCLEKCLAQLSERNRELILQYYSLEKEHQTGNRKDLAQSLGITVSALRIRAYRIRASIRKCVTSCLEETYGTHGTKSE